MKGYTFRLDEYSANNKAKIRQEYPYIRMQQSLNLNMEVCNK